jgi:hypothetical protein
MDEERGRRPTNLFPNVFGATPSAVACPQVDMDWLRNPLGGDADDETFDPEDAFVPDHLPEPGPFLAEARVLEGDEHVAVHAAAREAFGERGVFDATFGYNLAKLNRDRRHPDAGLRYGEAADGTLRVEFTPTTAFCPQGDSLARGIDRALNADGADHGYPAVAVRIRETHDRAGAINASLADREE